MEIFTHLRNMKDSDTEPNPGRRPYHSASYHRFFEDYVEYEAVNEKGKLVTNRVYIGDWYIEDAAENEKRKHRVWLAVLGLVEVAVFMWSSGVNIAANRVIYAVIFQFFVWAALLFGVFAFFNFLPVKEKMTKGDYTIGYRRFSTWCGLRMAAFAAAALVTLLAAALNQTDVLMHVICAGADILAGVAAKFQKMILKTMVRFRVEENKTVRPKNATVIKRRKK